MSPIYFEPVPDTDGTVLKKYNRWITQWFTRDPVDRRFWQICTPVHMPAGQPQMTVAKAVTDDFGNLVVVP